MARHASLADQYRAHRAEMELVLATGCTPIEARRELRARERARHQACGRRAPDQASADAIDADLVGHPGRYDEWYSPWMMRD